MPGTRTTFGRVGALSALLTLLQASGPLDGLQIVDWPDSSVQNEYVFLGTLTGAITQGPYFSGAPTVDDDEFIIPVHITAGKTAAQKTSLDARARCEAIMTAVRQTIASAKTLGDVPGLMYVTNAGADGPDPELLADPVGWVAYGTVRVGVKIRMR